GRRVREVPGGGAADGLEPERARHGCGDGDHPVLEGVRWVHRVVLDPEPLEPQRVGKPVGATERGEPGSHVHPLDARPAGQEGLVPPEAGGPLLHVLAEDLAVDRLQIVGGLEGAEALLADGERLDRVLLAADPALERGRRCDRRPRHQVTAPRSALPTALAYLASAPWVYRGSGARHAARRVPSSAASTARWMTRRPASITISSPSRTRAIGPPTNASGAMCPTL